jgi:hypothetical protein
VLEHDLSPGDVTAVMTAMMLHGASVGTMSRGTSPVSLASGRRP